MPESVLLTFDGRLYSAEVLQKAAYRAINYFTVDFVENSGVISCTLNPNIGISLEAFQHAVQEFKKDVLDYQLRAKLKAETEPVRNLILGIAFSKTGLQS